MEKNQIIKGYKIIKRIGKGGFGAVYLVEKKKKYYALKKITDLTKEEILKYQTLLNSLYKIKSEYIIKYYKSYIENDCIYIIMEYGGDTNLKQYIEEQNKSNCLIDEKIISDIIIQICIGIKEIHKNKLIHRDLTPENIFMDKNNKIKIGDFGVSIILTTVKNYAKTRIGKEHYLAPEIFGKKEYNNKVDIYALGCIIYELFTLNEYYIDTIIEEKDGKIDKVIYNPKWQNLIDLALTKDYHKRANIEEIINYIKNQIHIKNINLDDNNTIICYYNKNSKQGINLFHNINEENVEIYVNDKKIKFKYEYRSDEIGLIKVEYKFNKLLTSTAYMFYGCENLESINLSSFNSINVIDMSYMFSSCTNLKLIDLSSFNTNNVRDMNHMFSHCYSLKTIDLSSFNINNVKDMNNMFFSCLSLESIDLSSFNNTHNIPNMSFMFNLCKNLKPENIKIDELKKKLLNLIN